MTVGQSVQGRGEGVPAGETAGDAGVDVGGDRSLLDRGRGFAPTFARRTLVNVRPTVMMFYVALAVGLAVFALSGVQAAEAAPAIWYVAVGGADGNSCAAPSAPCLTIDAAIGKASGGDTIEVATGTYTGSGTE